MTTNSHTKRQWLSHNWHSKKCMTFNVRRLFCRALLNPIQTSGGGGGGGGGGTDGHGQNLPARSLILK